MTDEAVAGEPFVHRLGLCESEDVGTGTRVWAFAHVMAGAKVGADCNIGGHAFVESGAVVGDRVTIKNGVMIWDRVTIGNDVFLGPGVVFTNDLKPRAHIKKRPEELLPTTVESGATIGANSTIVCGITIGMFAFVAGGSTVTRDVAPHALVRGNPARQAGWVCECGLVLADDRPDHLRCECGRGYGVVDGRLTDLR